VTVIVGYLPTPEGDAALNEAAEQAKKYGDDLLLVNTAHGGAYTDSALASREHLAALANDLRQKYGVDVEVHQRTDTQDPVEHILEVISSTQARMLVIGLRRRSPVGKLFLGSNAQSLLLRAPCPVLAIKARTEED
jgi:nucleotide-binding universal stress UspA family protein